MHPESGGESPKPPKSFECIVSFDVDHEDVGEGAASLLTLPGAGADQRPGKSPSPGKTLSESAATPEPKVGGDRMDEDLWSGLVAMAKMRIELAEVEWLFASPFQGLEVAEADSVVGEGGEAIVEGGVGLAVPIPGAPAVVPVAQAAPIGQLSREVSLPEAPEDAENYELVWRKKE